MANVKYGVGFNPRIFDSIYNIRYLYWEVLTRSLNYVGARGKELLFNNFLRGQELRYSSGSAYDKDSKGRRKVSYSVGKSKGHVRISSYPVNLFEHGRMLRSGQREAGKNIILGKFNALMSNRLQGILNYFDSNVVNGLAKEVERDIEAGKYIPYYRPKK
jgi:hypothetical protein